MDTKKTSSVLDVSTNKDSSISITPKLRKSVDGISRNANFTPSSMEKLKRVRYSFESSGKTPLKRRNQSKEESNSKGNPSLHIHTDESEYVVGNGIDDINFSPCQLTHNSSLNMSFNDSFHRTIWKNSEKLFPSNDRKGSLAVMFVDKKSSKVLTCNEKSYELLECTENDLIDCKINDVLKSFEETSKKIVQIKTFKGEDLSVCLWVRKLAEGFLVMMEKVQCITGNLTLNKDKEIVYVDEEIGVLYGSSEELLGTHIKMFLPQFDMNKNIQYTCGLSIDDFVFPTRLERVDDKTIKLEAFLYLTGVVSVNTEGSIVNINNHLGSILLGYKSSSELRGNLISTILPELSSDENSTNLMSDVSSDKVDNIIEKLDHSLNIKNNIMIEEGSFGGFVRHDDGSFLPVMYDIEKTEQDLWLIWIKYGDVPYFHSYTDKDASKYSLIEEVNDENGLFTNKFESDRKFNDNYEVLEQIGKGAFGYVFIARQLSTDAKVVVKKIKKEKVLRKGWIKTEKGFDLPLEIVILLKIRHNNIVHALEAYESEKYFELIMKKHGNGMDMFELIEQASSYSKHNSGLEEPLAAFMFRQIASGVAYLHEKNIVHRDIKDENIIVDTAAWTLQIIDFGSAATIADGKTFGSFCGTVEYCSPEVLLGKRYRGPELDAFSLGVTLYTMVYGENPFGNAEETIECIVRPPVPSSDKLISLLLGLLAPNPKNRMTAFEASNNSWSVQDVDLNNYPSEKVIGSFEFRGNTAGDFRKDSYQTPIRNRKKSNSNQDECRKELFRKSF
ncbi:DgyrCDS2311 [Dimorphilus gyrociliatus]|uniref:DgyrCDS2311 n=1 Tax=Dimorphilus gyrociliatus TaxID=2664684 RepID=A0A7I8VA56_9ANNE|nr:DgyrCDS2311 [Dimorphilus gyrociliatus]